VDERSEYLSGGMRPVCCVICGCAVLVKKNSLAQTSIQWDAASVAACLEFVGTNSALVAGCGTLRRSIEDAVRSGTIEVPDG